jgi:hypothetical protein
MNRIAAASPVLLLAALLLTGCERASPPVGKPLFTTFDLGETFLDTGDHVIHFNAFTTDQLSPEVAQTYQIARSQSRALVNVTVLRRPESGAGSEPVRADVVSNTANLTGQRKALEFREIEEGGEAIYYIADVPVTSGETLMFEVEVTPVGSDTTHYLKFRRKFEF